MSSKSIKIATSELVGKVSETITSIKQNYSGLITVICPTNTASVFLRRQYESFNQHSIGVRFTTVSELTQLLEDASQENTLSTRTQTISHFDTCVSIARKLFPNSSPWIKAPLIRATLELLYSMDDEFHEQALNDYEIARECLDEYLHEIKPGQSPLVSSIPLEKIMGKCILVGYQQFDKKTQRFALRFGDYVESEILTMERTCATKIELFENPFDEIDSILEEILSIDDLRLDSCILVVPNNKYKLLAISVAQRKGIPMAGSSPSTIASHPFCELARYFLAGANEPITRDRIVAFEEKFPWIKNPKGNHPFISCHNAINSNFTVGQYFNSITDFIAEYIRPEFFKEDAEGAPDIHFSGDAYSLLLELSLSTSELSKRESLMLLEQEAIRKTLRVGALGEGLYMALTSEVFGSNFQHAFICGMNDTYVAPTPLRSSLIPRDQYERYEVNGKKDQDAEAQNLLSWLRNCSTNIQMSTSKFGIDGKATVLPYWADIKPADSASSLLSDFVWDDSIAVSADYAKELLSHEMNHVNSLAQISETSSISATGIEDVALCPSKFFHKRVLREISPLENENPDELLPAVLGSFVHDELEDYVSKELTQDQLVENIHLKIMEMERTGELPHNASAVITIQKLHRIINNFLILHEKAKAQSIEVETEVASEIKVGNQVFDIRGQIDRIQHGESGTTLVDYKTGKLNKSGDKFHLGRKIQLALYALMRDENTDALEYWHISEDEALSDRVEWNSQSKDEAIGLLESLGNIVHTGTFIPRDEYVEIMPKSVKHTSKCSRCELDPYCYQEQRVLWHNHKADSLLADYASATGETAFEEGPK